MFVICLYLDLFLSVLHMDINMAWMECVICLYLDLFLSVLHMGFNMAWLECVCYMSIS